MCHDDSTKSSRFRNGVWPPPLGLAELYHEILDLMKREVSKQS